MPSAAIPVVTFSIILMHRLLHVCVCVRVCVYVCIYMDTYIYIYIYQMSGTVPLVPGTVAIVVEVKSDGSYCIDENDALGHVDDPEDHLEKILDAAVGQCAFTTIDEKPYIYIYIYIYMCVRVCVCMYIYGYIYIYIYIYIHIYIYIYIYIYQITPSTSSSSLSSSHLTSLSSTHRCRPGYCATRFGSCDGCGGIKTGRVI